MTELSLFPEPVEERIQRIDAEILALLIGKSGGPLGLHLSHAERLVLSAIRFCRGAARAITIRDMRNFKGCEELDAREIKEAVRALRINFRVPIGSSKMSSGGGYFIMLTAEDHSILHKQVLDQVRAEIEVLKAVDGPRTTLELLGQLQLEIGAAAQEVA
jgi:hypothetical protein